MLDLIPIQGDFKKGIFSRPGVNLPFTCVFNKTEECEKKNCDAKLIHKAFL